MQLEQTNAAEGPDASAVLRFLTANPEFFNQHEEVLPRLRIPHVSGKAVSLIERQVSVLRGKCATLENHLRDLIGVAHANEQLQARLHALVQEIISAPTLDVVMASTRRSLAENFGADAVHVLLIAHADDRSADVDGADLYGADDGWPDDETNRGETTAGETAAEDVPWCTIAGDDPRLERFSELFEDGGTRCGLPDAVQLDLLVGDAQAAVGSAALIPLQHEGRLGIVMLSSRDESRFASGKGVVFLDQLGGVLGRRVRALGRVTA